jgi:hypothetical protein
MSEFILNARPYLECASFVGTIALSFIALYGLKQIQLLKIDMLNRSERSAKEKAIEAAENFWAEFTVSYFAFQQEIFKRGLKVYDGKVGDFKRTEFPDWPNCPQEILKRWELATLWLVSSNRFEAIAATFVTGVADEQTGFEVIGLDFVEMVQNDYDMYTLTQKMAGGEKQYFPNTIKLFKAWSPRFTQKELELQKHSLEEKIKNLDRFTMPTLRPSI